MARVNRRVSRPVTALMGRVARWDGVSPRDALARVGGLFTPVKEKIFLGSGREIEDKRAIINPENGVILGVTGDGYEPLSNDILWESMEQLGDALGEKPKVSAAHCLDGGRIVSLEGVIGSAESIIPGDDVIPIVKILQGHGGSHSADFLFELSRLICSNGARVAIKGTKHCFSVRHTATVKTRYDFNFKRVLEVFAKGRDNMLANFRKFAATPMSKAETLAYFRAIAESRSEKDKKAEQTVENLLEVWNHPRQLMGGDTLWRAFNAATEFTQHWGFRDDESMVLNNLGGKATALKDSAYQIALELAS